jgi:hypothetical protein
MLGSDPPARREPMVIKFDEEKFPKNIQPQIWARTETVSTGSHTSNDRCRDIAEIKQSFWVLSIYTIQT